MKKSLISLVAIVSFCWFAYAGSPSKEWEFTTISAANTTEIKAAVTGRRLVLKNIIGMAQTAGRCYLTSNDVRISPDFWLGANGGLTFNENEKVGFTGIVGQDISIWCSTNLATTIGTIITAED